MDRLTLYFGIADIASLLVGFFGGVACLVAAYLSDGRTRGFRLIAAAIFAAIPAIIFAAQYVHLQRNHGAGTSLPSVSPK